MKILNQWHVITGRAVERSIKTVVDEQPGREASRKFSTLQIANIYQLFPRTSRYYQDSALSFNESIIFKKQGFYLIKTSHLKTI